MSLVYGLCIWMTINLIILLILSIPAFQLSEEVSSRLYTLKNTKNKEISHSARLLSVFYMELRRLYEQHRNHKACRTVLIRKS